jgi:hypothetical protein
MCILNITVKLNIQQSVKLFCSSKVSYLQTLYSEGTQMVWDKIYKQCDSKACNMQYDSIWAKTGYVQLLQ